MDKVSHLRVHPYKVILFAVAAVVTLWALPKLQMVGFALFLTVVFSLLLDAPVSFLEKRRVPRALATTGVFLALAGSIVGALALLVPTVIGQFQELGSRHGAIGTELTTQVNEYTSTLPFSVPALRPEYLEGGNLLDSLGGMGVVASTGMFLGALVVALFAALWAVANPQPLQARLLAFLPPRRRGQVAEIARAVEERLRRWLLGQLVLSVAVGLSTYVLLRALGVPFAAMFAVIAAILEAVPTFGVVLAAVGPFLLLLLDDPSKLVWFLLGVVVIQQLEDRLLVPVVMKKALNIPQTFLIFIMLGAGALFGPIGLLMAVPLTAAGITIHDAVMAYDEREAEVMRVEAEVTAATKNIVSLVREEKAEVAPDVPPVLPLVDLPEARTP